MEGVWDDEYEEDDLDYYGEAQEVSEPERKRIKLLDEDPTKEAKKPKIVKNPRPKLDIDAMLNEDKGLPELLRMATDVIFREGHEFEDMKQLLSVMQLWSHRLFPKYTFKDFLAKAEVLGKRRPVKTHIRKVRIGML